MPRILQLIPIFFKTFIILFENKINMNKYNKEGIENLMLYLDNLGNINQFTAIQVVSLLHKCLKILGKLKKQNEQNFNYPYNEIFEIVSNTLRKSVQKYIRYEL